MAGNVKQLKENIKSYYEEMIKLPQETKTALFDGKLAYKEYCKQLKKIYNTLDGMKTKGMVPDEDRQAAELLENMVDIAGLNFAPKRENTKRGKMLITKHAAVLGEVSDFLGALRELGNGESVESLSKNIKKKQEAREEDRYMASAYKQWKKGSPEKFDDVDYQKTRADKMLKYLKSTKSAFRPDSAYFKALENSLKAFKAFTDQLPAGGKLDKLAAGRLYDHYVDVYNAANDYMNRTDGSYARAERMDMARLIRDAVRDNVAVSKKEYFEAVRKNAEKNAERAEKLRNHYQRMTGTAKTNVWERDPDWNITEERIAKCSKGHPPVAVTKPEAFSEAQMRGLIISCAFSDHCMTIDKFEQDSRTQMVNTYLPDKEKARLFTLDGYYCLMMENVFYSNDVRAVGNAHLALQQGREYANAIMAMKPEERNQLIGAVLSEGIRHITGMMKELTDETRISVGAGMLRDILEMTGAEGISQYVTVTEEEKQVARGYVELAEIMKKQDLGMLLDESLDKETRNDRLAELFANELMKLAYRDSVDAERNKNADDFSEKTKDLFLIMNDGEPANGDENMESAANQIVIDKTSPEYMEARAEYDYRSIMDVKIKDAMPSVLQILDHRERMVNDVKALVKNSPVFAELENMTSYDLLTKKLRGSCRFDTVKIMDELRKDPKFKKQVSDIMEHGRAAISQKELSENLGLGNLDPSGRKTEFKGTAKENTKNSLAL